MPQLVICHKCGTTLYEGEELKPLDEIIQGYDGRCPSCNKMLSSLPKNIEVKPIDVPNWLNPFEPKKEKRAPIKKRELQEKGVYVSSKPRSRGMCMHALNERK